VPRLVALASHNSEECIPDLPVRGAEEVPVQGVPRIHFEAEFDVLAIEVELLEEVQILIVHGEVTHVGIGPSGIAKTRGRSHVTPPWVGHAILREIAFSLSLMMDPTQLENFSLLLQLSLAAPISEGFSRLCIL
jgi:hypothetical protein